MANYYQYRNICSPVLFCDGTFFLVFPAGGHFQKPTYCSFPEEGYTVITSAHASCSISLL